MLCDYSLLLLTQRHPKGKAVVAIVVLLLPFSSLLIENSQCVHNTFFIFCSLLILAINIVASVLYTTRDIPKYKIILRSS